MDVLIGLKEFPSCACPEHQPDVVDDDDDEEEDKKKTTNATATRTDSVISV